MTDEEKLAVMNTLEREGMAEPIVQVAKLLNSPDGLGKHGVRRWMKLSLEEIESKAIRHGLKEGTKDERSGFDHLTHALSRTIQGAVLRGRRK